MFGAPWKPHLESGVVPSHCKPVCSPNSSGVEWGSEFFQFGIPPRPFLGHDIACICPGSELRRDPPNFLMFPQQNGRSMGVLALYGSLAFNYLNEPDISRCSVRICHLP